jgi:hypothetical protein
VVGRIYTDTSVIGGCEDDEFRVHSRRLMDAFVRGDLRLVLSELTLRELAPAPPAVREVLAMVPDGHIEVVRLTPAADELARRYLAEGILKANMLADAQHIAMATVANVDALVRRELPTRCEPASDSWVPWSERQARLPNDRDSVPQGGPCR